MKGEINRDWYCAFGRNKNKQKDICHNGCDYYKCEAYHRKWPTPKQFKGEYGEEWNGACYWLLTGTWQLVHDSWPIDNSWLNDNPVVCACTPWGKPPKDWMPE